MNDAYLKIAADAITERDDLKVVLKQVLTSFVVHPDYRMYIPGLTTRQWNLMQGLLKEVETEQAP